MNYLEERLLRDTTKMPGGCWLWTGYCMAKNGHGQLTYRGKSLLVHRAAASLWLGFDLATPPSEAIICHECDVPNCINPNPGHLYIGTYSTNITDAYRRGQRKDAKLDMRKSSLIRRAYATGRYSQRELARRTHVSQRTILNIIHGKIWI